MKQTQKPSKTRCCHASASPNAAALSLPVLSAGNTVRPSKRSRWRALSLVLVHVAIIGHIVHWLISGRTLSPVEPSETMYTLDKGEFNAGFFFFLAAILATAVFGRFFCGWGCHLVAYQDLCAWLLKKVRLKPKPFRSRFLFIAPLALAIYMFVWPSVYRWLAAAPLPKASNHLLTTEFWATFPGPIIAVLTFAICGFVIVYFLGGKGFCTYGCPYGGFFALADRVAPGNILVTDACEHCGHCTAVCTSNVKVHEEVALFGMVVDPGCMKCMDCVSVCPNDALYFGFSKPALGVKPKSSRRAVSYDFSLAEEIAMVVIGVVALLIFRGLYDQVPLLMAMGTAAILAFLCLKLVRVIGSSNVRLQSLQLKRGGLLTKSGWGFLAATLALLAFTVHSGVVQFSRWRGTVHARALNLGDEIWSPDYFVPYETDKFADSRMSTAITYLERMDRWGFMLTPLGLNELVRLYVAENRLEDAERLVRRLIAFRPEDPGLPWGLGNIARKAGRIDDAEKNYRDALEADKRHEGARRSLHGLLMGVGRVEEAFLLSKEAIALFPDDPHWSLDLGQSYMKLGRFSDAVGVLADLVARQPTNPRGHWLLGVTRLHLGDGRAGVEHLDRATQLDGNFAEAQFDLGLALLQLGDLREGEKRMKEVVRIHPEFAPAHDTLGEIAFLGHRFVEAASHFREYTRLNPNDPDGWDSLSLALQQIGDMDGASKAEARAASVRSGSLSGN